MKDIISVGGELPGVINNETIEAEGVIVNAYKKYQHSAAKNNDSGELTT